MLATATFEKSLLKTLLKEDFKSIEWEVPVAYQRASRRP